MVCWNLRYACGFCSQVGSGAVGADRSAGNLTLFSVEPTHPPLACVSFSSAARRRACGLRTGRSESSEGIGRCHQCPRGLWLSGWRLSLRPSVVGFTNRGRSSNARSPASPWCRGSRVSFATPCQLYPWAADKPRESSRARRVLRVCPESRGCRKRPRPLCFLSCWGHGRALTRFKRYRRRFGWRA